MKRIALLTMMLFLMVSFGCTGMHQINEPTRAKLWHVVIVRFKNPGDAEAHKKVYEAAQTLRKIKGVCALYTGKSIKSDRAKVDSDYDVAVNIGFESVADMQAYITDPIHVKAVNEVLKPIARDFTIYDFQNE